MLIKWIFTIQTAIIIRWGSWMLSQSLSMAMNSMRWYHICQLRTKLKEWSYLGLLILGGVVHSLLRCKRHILRFHRLSLFHYCLNKIPKVPVPKFIRDNIDVSDIQGAKVRKLFTRPARDILMYRDIEGAFPKKKHKHIKDYAFDDYSDVTRK